MLPFLKEMSPIHFKLKHFTEKTSCDFLKNNLIIFFFTVLENKQMLISFSP